MTTEELKKLAEDLKRAQESMYCSCGENSAHDPAEMCLQCSLSLAEQRLMEKLNE